MLSFEPYQKYFDIIGKNKDNIIIIEDFIEPEDLSIINTFLNKYENDDEFMGGKDMQQDVVRSRNPQVADLLIKYEEKTFDVIKKVFTEKYKIPLVRKPVNFTHLVKWVPGMNSKLHADCQKPDGTPAYVANFHTYNVSVLMYPNDSYTGGEITFPAYDLVVKPKAGSFIAFPGNVEYSHTVEKVQSGTRYTMPSWYSFDVDRPEDLEKIAGMSYLDSVQLWEGTPDFHKIDPVGIDAKRNFNNDQKS